MPLWLLSVLNWLALLATIVLTHSLILYSQFYRKAEGYMWRAARRLWLYLLMFFSIEWLVGAFFFHLAKEYLPRYASVPILLLAAVMGIMIAAIPTSLEAVLLPASNTTLQTLERPLTKLLLKLKFNLRYNFAHAIESCRQQDLFDCQQPNSLGPGLTPRTIGRRLRMLYEFCKVDIARERQDATLLRRDAGYVPWYQYYLLSRHLGRRRLMDSIINPITPPCPGWDGSERRRQIEGDRTKRKEPEGIDNPRVRVYDDPEHVARLLGEQGASIAPRSDAAD